MENCHISGHPLIRHKLSLLREKKTETKEFRRLMKEVSYLLAYEATRFLPLKNKEIETPLCKSSEPLLKEETPALISILRAGNGLLDGFLELLPDTSVGFLGLYREEKAKRIVEYYAKLPDLNGKRAIVVDPMLATGKSATIALNRLKKENPSHIDFVCLLASKDGLDYLASHHPDVTIFTACVDSILDDKAYIVPGLGDAGDRFYGTGTASAG